MQAYVSQDGKKKTHRDTYTRKIQDLEVQGKALRDKQKIIKETHEPNLRQMDMWRDLIRMLECKRSIALNAAKEQAPGQEDRLVF